MAYAFVAGQIVEAENVASGNSQIDILPNNPTPGNLVVAWAFYFDAAVDRTIGVQDTAGIPNVYQEVNTHVFNTTDGSMRMFYLLNAPAGATKTLTAAYSAAVTFRQVIAVEYSGLSAFQTSASQRQGTPGAGADQISTGLMTPTSQPAALIAWLMDASAATAVTPSAGFTSRFAAPTLAGGSFTLIEDIRLTSASAVAATGTCSAGGAQNFICQGAVFTETPPAVTSSSGPLMFNQRNVFVNEVIQQF